MNILEKCSLFKSKQVKDDTCYLLDIPLELRNLIYDKLDHKSILTCRLINRKCHQEINGLYNFTCKSIKLTDNVIKPCEMKLTIKFCTIEKMWKPIDTIFQNLIQIKRLVISLGQISLHNLNTIMQECGPYVNQLIVQIPCIFSNTPSHYNRERAYSKKIPHPFEFRKLTLLQNTTTWGYYKKHPDNLDNMLETIALSSGKIETLKIIVKLFCNYYDNGEEIKRLASEAVEESIKEFFFLCLKSSRISHKFAHFPCVHNLSVSREPVTSERNGCGPPTYNPIRNRCTMFELFIEELKFRWNRSKYREYCRRFRIACRVPVVPVESKGESDLMSGQASSVVTRRHWLYPRIRGNGQGHRILVKETVNNNTEITDSNVSSGSSVDLRKRFRWSVFGMILHTKWYASKETFIGKDFRTCLSSG